MIFNDLIYGKFETPEWLDTFIRLPEFLRLRGVRLSNLDSIEFKDLNAQTRWDHCIAVSHLALRFCKKKKLSLEDTVNLTIAALLHDIATPPFAHTLESIFSDFNHEIETVNLLSSKKSRYSDHNTLVYLSNKTGFLELCEELSKRLGIKVDHNKITEKIIGQGQHGFAIKGSIDLDNIDNVLRVAHLMGNQISKELIYELVDYLSEFENAPDSVYVSDNIYVKEWVKYRMLIYSNFYNSTHQELGREALLQHILFKAHLQGMVKENMIWNTDNKLLDDIYRWEHSNENLYKLSLKQLVSNYLLLEPMVSVGEIIIEDQKTLSKLLNPDFSNWLRDKISSETLEIFFIVKKKKFKQKSTLFDNELGKISFYKYGSSNIKRNQMPLSLIQDNITDAISSTEFTMSVKNQLKEWLENQDYLQTNSTKLNSIIQRLDSVQDWSFKQYKNKSLHKYPGTFVFAIPATLIKALGLQGGNILDTFGGTGQTANEAIKYNCTVTTNDINKVAFLTTKVRFTYYKQSVFAKLLAIQKKEIKESNSSFFPTEDLQKWHHKKTRIEISKILYFISNFDRRKIVKYFLTLALSNILNNTTERKGKEHGYFADNTPLPKGTEHPKYVDAIELFLMQIRKNVKTLQNQYSILERININPEEAFKKVTTLNLDVISEKFRSHETVINKYDGIITSPPYLCMADYTLGQRLSYYWLFDSNMKLDFNKEIGARRKRSSPLKAHNNYMKSMDEFFKTSSNCLNKNGFLAIIIGKPKAKKYSESQIITDLISKANKCGLSLIWKQNREINWHRNHGYARLKNEQIIVFQKQ